MSPWVIIMIGVVVAHASGFAVGAWYAAGRIGRLMRTPKFWAALHDHVLREIRFRCVHELEARKCKNQTEDEGAWASGEENRAEACGVGIGVEWRDADVPQKKE